jgi:hypothetical protein
MVRRSRRFESARGLRRRACKRGLVACWWKTRVRRAWRIAVAKGHPGEVHVRPHLGARVAGCLRCFQRRTRRVRRHRLIALPERQLALNEQGTRPRGGGRLADGCHVLVGERPHLLDSAARLRIAAERGDKAQCRLLVARLVPSLSRASPRALAPAPVEQLARAPHQGDPPAHRRLRRLPPTALASSDSSGRSSRSSATSGPSPADT